MDRRSVCSVFLGFVVLAAPADVSLQNKNRGTTTVVQQDCQAQVNKAVGEYKGQITSLRTQVQKLNELNTQYKTRIGELEGKIAAHAGEMNGLRTRANELGAEAERFKLDNARLTNENAEMKGRIDSLGGEKKALEDRKNAEIARLTGDRDSLQRQLNAARSGSISNGGGAELSAAIESKDREIAEVRSNYSALAAQCIKDPNQILDDIKKRNDGDTSGQYYMMYENGQRYQARDLLIGTLMFPDSSELQFEPGQRGAIEVIFRPRMLGDHQTKWFVDLRIFKGEIEDKMELIEEAEQSKKGLRREIKPGIDEKWVWKTKDVYPSGFEKHEARVLVDAGYLASDGAPSVNIEDHEVVLTEKVVQGWLSKAWEWFGRNVTILLTILSGILGLVTIYLGIAKSGLETRKAQLELEMTERSRVSELEAKTSTLESQPKPAT